MTARRQKRTQSAPSRPQTVPIEITLEEIEILLSVSHYQGRVMGAVRRLIQLSSRGEMREKARFVREESYWLRRFASASREELRNGGAGAAQFRFTPRTLTAFLGRLLASLNVPRSRRRLSPEQIRRREELAEKLTGALRALQDRAHPLVSAELETRRPVERAWIEDVLAGRGGPEETAQLESR